MKIHGKLSIITLLSLLCTVIVWTIATSDRTSAFQTRMPNDLKVYVKAGDNLNAGQSLYDGDILPTLPFTYPPFAGSMFKELTKLSDGWITFFWQAGIFICLLAVIVLVLRERGLKLGVGGAIIAVLLTIAATGTEPIHGTYYFGQINVLLMLLVALDFLPKKLKWHGAGIGLAAGIKLTPAFLGIVLLIQRRFWAALNSVIAFLVTVFIGFLLIPDAERFWTESMFNSNRVGEHSNPGAQSLRSIIERSFGIENSIVWVIAVLLTITLVAVSVSAAVKAKNATLAMSFAGMGACLVSPFSWYHHWVWVIPLAVAIFVWVNQTLGARFDSALGQQAAGALSVLAMITAMIPYVNAHVWRAPSFRGLSETMVLGQFGEVLYCGFAIIAMVVYSVTIFSSRLESKSAGKHRAQK